MNYKKGSPRPDGYVAVHDWAEDQIKAGLKQTQCEKCELWKFPQEMDGKTCRECDNTGTEGE